MVCESCGRLVDVRERRCPFCGRPLPGLFGFSTALRRWGLEFDRVLIGLAVAMYVLTLAADPSAISGGGGGFLSFLAPANVELFRFGASGAIPVFRFGRWWTVLSAGWLHGGLLHILFNMLWLRQLAPAVSRLYGAARMVIVYTVASICGFALSSFVGAYFVFLPGFLRGAGFTVGASAAIFGLLGALVWYGRRGGSSALGRQAWTWAIALFAFGFIFPGVDNWAHLGGYLGGYLAARMLDPLRDETASHIVLAGLCLLAAVAAIVVSAITAGPLLAQ